MLEMLRLRPRTLSLPQGQSARVSSIRPAG